MTPVGRLVLNRNPDNFFAETEQVAFCTAHIVPGHRLHQRPAARRAASTPTSTRRSSRLGGPNFHEIPINAPIAQVHNNQRDGMHRQAIHRGRVAYEPNSLGGGCPFQAGARGLRRRSRSRSTRTRCAASRRSSPTTTRRRRCSSNSQTPVEQAHIVARVPLRADARCRCRRSASAWSRCSRTSSRSSRERVADGPRHRRAGAACRARSRRPPKPEVTMSPALSLLARPGDGSIRTRRSRAPRRRRRRRRVAARRSTRRSPTAGAVPRFVGARLGAVRPARRRRRSTSKSRWRRRRRCCSTRVVLPDGERRRRSAALGQAVEFIKDQYRHCKPILALGARERARRARAMLPATLPDGSDDPGLVIGTIGRCRQRLHRRPRAPPPLRARNRSAEGLTHARASMRPSPPRPPRRRAGVRVRFAQHLRGRFSRKTLIVDIVIAVVITALVAFVVFNAQSGEKKIQHQIEHLYATDDPQFLRAMGVLLGPPLAGRQPGTDACVNGDRDLPADARGDPRRAQRRSPSRPTSTGRATIGKEFADALAERARAGVKVHVLLDWVGSEKMDDALRRRDEGGRRRGRALPPAALVHTSAASTTARTASSSSSTAQVGFTGGVGIADEWTRQRAGPGALARLALPASRARSSRRCRPRSWTTGSRPPARCCTATTTSRRSQPAGRRARRCSRSSPSGGSESMRADVPAVDRRGDAQRSASSSAYFVPDDLARPDAGRGDEARREACRSSCPGEHIDTETVRAALARALGRAARGGRRDLRVPADDVPLQGDDRRRPAGLGRLDQLRQPLVPAQRRGEPQRLRRGVRRRAGRRSSRPTWRSRAASRSTNGRRGR